MRSPTGVVDAPRKEERKGDLSTERSITGLRWSRRDRPGRERRRRPENEETAPEAVLPSPWCALVALMCRRRSPSRPSAASWRSRPRPPPCHRRVRWTPRWSRSSPRTPLLRGNPPTSGILYCDSSVAERHILRRCGYCRKCGQLIPGHLGGEYWHKHLYDEFLLFSSGGELATLRGSYLGGKSRWIGGEARHQEPLARLRQGLYKIVIEMSKPIPRSKNFRASYARLDVYLPRPSPTTTTAI